MDMEARSYVYISICIGMYIRIFIVQVCRSTAVNVERWAVSLLHEGLIVARRFQVPEHGLAL